MTLIELFIEILQRVFRQPITHFVGWVRSLHFLAQASLTLAVIMIAVTWVYGDALAQWTSLDERLVRTIALGKAKPPISQDFRKPLSRKIENRVAQLSAQLEQIYTPHPPKEEYESNAWAVAEMIAALRDRNLDADKVKAYFDSRRGGIGSKDFGPNAQFVWSQYSNYPPLLDATSWVFLAFAQVKRPVGSEALEFLLENQKRDGWWAMYPGSNQEEWNASTDATAMAIWALHEQLPFLNEDDKQRTIRSISIGAQWLYGQRIANTARWKDYPTGNAMVSLSGLTLHVLHLIGTYDLRDIDRLWLRSLPSALPAADNWESSVRTVFRKPNDPIQSDNVRHYILPWGVIATIDAYPNGNLFERIFALFWLERLLAMNPLETLKGNTDDNWVLGLDVMALKML